MILSDAAVKNRVSVLVLLVIIVIIGLYSYRVLPRESAPDITIPYVFVRTDYRGVSASDIETAITIKIEKKLKGLDKVKNISSVSSQGLSQISIEFCRARILMRCFPGSRTRWMRPETTCPRTWKTNPWCMR